MRSHTTRRATIGLLLVLAVAACATAEGTSQDPTSPSDGTCLGGASRCDDDPTGGELSTDVETGP